MSPASSCPSNKFIISSANDKTLYFFASLLFPILENLPLKLGVSEPYNPTENINLTEGYCSWNLSIMILALLLAV